MKNNKDIWEMTFSEFRKTKEVTSTLDADKWSKQYEQHKQEYLDGIRYAMTNGIAIPSDVVYSLKIS